MTSIMYCTLELTCLLCSTERRVSKTASTPRGVISVSFLPMSCGGQQTFNDGHRAMIHTNSSYVERKFVCVKMCFDPI